MKLVRQKSNKLAFLNYNKDYQYLLIRIEDVCNNAYIFNYPKILFFVNSFEKKIINDYLKYYPNIKANYFSNIINNEQELLVLYQDNLITNDFTTLLKISYADKFITLSHRDVLGSILALGIQRNNIGDIIKQEKYFYVEVKKDISNYIIDNLVKINNSKIKINKSEEIITRNQEYLSYQGVVKSLRLDNVVKLITNKSNNEVREYLLAQNVKVNQIIKDDFSYQIKENVELSLKGYGRYYLDISNIKQTKKDNYLLSYLKYV